MIVGIEYLTFWDWIISVKNSDQNLKKFQLAVPDIRSDILKEKLKKYRFETKFIGKWVFFCTKTDIIFAKW